MSGATLRVLLVAAVAAVLLCPAVEGFPVTQDTNEVVPEHASVLIDGDGNPDHNIAEDPTDPYEVSQNPFTAAMDKDDDPMKIESPVRYKGDQWEKFALRHETEAEMDPSKDDESLDKNWQRDLAEPHMKMSIPSDPALLKGMSQACEKLGQDLCGDGSCSHHCATMMADTARPFTVDGSDHQPEMAKAVFNIHHHAHFMMSTENTLPAKMPKMPTILGKDKEQLPTTLSKKTVKKIKKAKKEAKLKDGESDLVKTLKLDRTAEEKVLKKQDALLKKEAINKKKDDAKSKKLVAKKEAKKDKKVKKQATQALKKKVAKAKKVAKESKKEEETAAKVIAGLNKA